MNQKKIFKANAYTIIKFLSRYLFLLIIPILQQLVLIPFDLINIFHAIGLNMFFLILIVIYSIFEFRSINYNINQKSLVVKKGFLLTHIYSISLDSIHSIYSKSTILSNLFSAVNFDLETSAGKKNKADIGLSISKKNYALLKQKIFKIQNLHFSYKPSILKILFVSLLWSNPITGLLILEPFLNKTADIIGENLISNLYSKFDFSLYLVAIGVPAATAFITYIILTLWIISFLIHVFKYANFKVISSKTLISINYGFISKNEYIINKSKINAVLVKQTLLMYIFKLYTAYINTMSSGKYKHDKNLLVAAVHYKDLWIHMNNLLSLKTSIKMKDIKSAKETLVGFIMLPSIFLLLSLLILFFIPITIIYELQVALLIILIVMSTWWILFRIIAYKNNGISYFNDYLQINGYKKLSLYSTIIPKNNIQTIIINQNLFQKKSCTCNIRISIFSEKNIFFEVKSLPVIEVQKMIKTVLN